jgi:hypothetical protein
MRRYHLTLVLLAACAGCDAAKLNDLAKQAVKSAVDDSVVTTAPTPESSLAGIADNFERLADTLAAIHDESSARANVGRFKRLVEQLRRQFSELKESSALERGEVPPELLADRERWEKAARRFLVELDRVSRSPEIRSVMAQAYKDLKLGESPWEFLEGPSQPAPLVGIADSRPFSASPAAGQAAESTGPPLAHGGPPIHPRMQDIRDRIERSRQEAAARRPTISRPAPLEGEDVLMIVVENVPSDVFQSLIQRCAAITSSTGYQAEKTGGRFLFRIRHTEDLALVSKKIDFGAVTAIDQPSRTITIKYGPSNPVL